MAEVLEVLVFGCDFVRTPNGRKTKGRLEDVRMGSAQNTLFEGNPLEWQVEVLEEECRKLCRRQREEERSAKNLRKDKVLKALHCSVKPLI